MTNIFQKILSENNENIPPENNNTNVFQKILSENNQDAEPRSQEPKPQESLADNMTRTLAQIPQALMEFSSPGMLLSGLQLAGTGESLAEGEKWKNFREEELRAKFPSAPWPENKVFDEKKYNEAIQQASETFPTVGNIARMVEESTGVPLEPKTPTQKIVRLITGAGKIAQGSSKVGAKISENLTQKFHTGIKAATYSSALQAGGVPEEPSNLLGLLMSNFKFPSLEQEAKAAPTKADKFFENNIDTEPPPPPPGGGEPPPPGGGGPLFKNLIPEHEILEKIEPILQEELQTKIGAIGEKPYVESIQKEMSQPKPKINEINLENKVGSIISKTRINNRTDASQSLKNKINQFSGADYKDINKLYDISKAKNRASYNMQPKMINQLEGLVDDISLAEVPSNVKKDIRNIAKKYIKLGGGEEGYKEISNSQIIAQIQANNQKINHDYLQGRPSNSYLRLNEILGDAIEGTAGNNQEAVDSFNAARKAYANWNSTFGSKEVLPWREKGNVAFTKLLKSIENPDQLTVLKPILDRSPQGKQLYNEIRRNFIEKEMRPYIKNPNKTNTVEYAETMRELEPITTPEERAKMEIDIDKPRQAIENYDRSLKAYNDTKESHLKLINKQKENLSEWKGKLNDIKKNFPYKSDQAILRDLTDVRGLRRLRKNIPNNAEGNALYNQIKEYAPAKLLTQGKIIPSDKAESLKKILNDINSRALLEETLGKDVTNDLYKIINNPKKVEASFARKLKKGLSITKTVGKYVPGLRGQIATGEALYDTYRLFKPAAESANYETMDLNVLKKIIENRKDILP